MSTMLETYLAAVDAGDLDAAVTAYRAMDSGDKARARARIADVARDYIMAGDLVNAQFAVAVQDAQSVKINAPTVIDWNERVATRLATLDRAADLVRTGQNGPEVPEGTVLDFDVIIARAAELADDEAVHAAAVKIAEQAIGRGTVAAGGDIAAHVDEALRQQDGDFMTVAEIRNALTDAYPGDQRPSAGAISARLFPRDGSDCTIPGVTPVPATKDAPNGARLNG